MKRVLILFALGIVLPATAQEAKKDSLTVDMAVIKDYIAKLEKTIAGKETEPSENVYKNIQSLKGIPAGRLLKIMEMGFGPALGVGCDHCHDVQKWESDEKKEKQIARKMWTMSGNIRKELAVIVNDKATINCTTCHRGQVRPATSLK